MTRVKICGITNLDDAIAVVEAGADMLGFNFYPPSPRAIPVAECAKIITALKQYPVLSVGVFVNMPVENAIKIMRDCQLDLAQLHGDETPDDLIAFEGKAFKAFRGIPEDAILQKYLAHGSGISPSFLLDASVTGVYGGSGEIADWQEAGRLSEGHPFLLAGGLKPVNVASAIQVVRPWGVDTASGVEIRPGVKDIKKVKEFIEAVKSAEQTY